MRIGNCNCGKKVNCGCGPLTFDTYNVSSTSVLEVGNLVDVGGCILQEYVIDWYRDGARVLVTGKGIDPEIQAFHPMTGNAALPVVGGIYIPVVRYVVIDGLRLFTKKRHCRNWCDIESNLPTINVGRINCGVSNITGLYQYRVTYRSTDPNSLPSRTIAFDLPSDNSAVHFAFAFYAYDVADKIEVFFNDESNRLAAWIVGSDVPSTNYEKDIPEFRPATSQTAAKHVIALPAYSGGDFLIIKITPSVLTPSVKQTDWMLDLKCLGSNVLFDCSLLSTDKRQYDISTWQWVNVPASCEYRFSMDLLNAVSNFQQAGNYYRPFADYANVGIGTFNMALAYNHSSPKTWVRFPYSKIDIVQAYNIQNHSVRTASVGNINLTKNGNVFTWTFSSIDDFNQVQNWYASSQSGLWWSNWVDDPTDVRYYRWWHWRWKSRPENCGDNAVSSDRTLYFHRKSTVTFSSSGGVHTLTIVALQVTNEYSNETCNSAVTIINSRINFTNAAINTADYNENSLCFEWKMFGLGYGSIEPIFSFNRKWGAGTTVSLQGNNNPCSPGWKPETCTQIGQLVWRFFIYYINVEIDLAIDPNTGDFPRDGEGNYINDPFQNFSVYEGIDPTTKCNTPITNESNLVLRIVDGVQTFPT